MKDYLRYKLGKSYWYYSQDTMERFRLNTYIGGDEEDLLKTVLHHNEIVATREKKIYMKKDYIKDCINLAFMSFWNLNDEKQERLIKYLLEEIEEDDNNTKIIKLGGEIPNIEVRLEQIRTDKGNIFFISQKLHNELQTNVNSQMIINEDNEISDYYEIGEGNLIKSQDINIGMFRNSSLLYLKKCKEKYKELELAKIKEKEYLLIIKKHLEFIKRAERIKKILENIDKINNRKKIKKI